LIQQSFLVEIYMWMRKGTHDDTQVAPCPRMPPSAAVNVYDASQYGAQPSGVWTSQW
jgi:hypothetical protein